MSRFSKQDLFYVFQEASSLCAFLPLVNQSGWVRVKRHQPSFTYKIAKQCPQLHLNMRDVSILTYSEFFFTVCGFTCGPEAKRRGQLVLWVPTGWMKTIYSTLQIEHVEFIGRSGCSFNPISTMTERYELADLCTLLVINRANMEVKKNGERCKNNHRLKPLLNNMSALCRLIPKLLLAWAV